MNNSSIFLVTLLLGAAVLVGILFAPYFPVFILAIVFGTIFHPLNLKLRKKMSPGLAAALSTLTVLLLILGPIAFIGAELVRQVVSLSSTLTDSHALSAAQVSLEAWVNRNFPYAHIDLISYSKAGLTWIVAHLDNAFSGVLKTGTTLFLGAIALFYWFKDSHALYPLAMRLSPLNDRDDKDIIDKLSSSIRNVMRGTMIIALAQGLIAGIGYAIFGVPNAVLWGAVTTIAALIPGIGTSLVLIPVILYLLATGNNPGALGLVIWGGLAVGLIDNLIGPRLMTRGANIHPFFILISVLGGIQLFGPVGFLAGPLLVSFFFALLDVYSIYQKQRSSSVL